MSTPDRARVSILGGSIATGTSTAIRLGLSFLLSVLIARLLGAEVKGQFALLQQVPAVIALLLGAGFDGAHAYYVGRRLYDARSSASDSVLIVGVSALLGIPAAILVMSWLLPPLESAPMPVLVGASIAIPLAVASSHLSGILTGLARVSQMALAQAVTAVVTFAGIVAFATFGHLDLGTLVVATVIGILAGTLLSIRFTGIAGVGLPSLSRIADRWSYARRSYVQSVTGYLELRQDVLLLGMLSTAAGVGIYTVSAAFAELLFYAPQTISTALTARALQEDAGVGADLTAAVTRVLTAFMIITAVVLALMMGPLVALVFGAEFAPAAQVFLFLVPGIIAWGAASQPAAYLATHGRLFPRVSTATLFVNLGLNLALIPSLGVTGAAIATSISYSLSSVYIISTFLKVSESRLADLLMIRATDITLALNALRGLRSKRGRRG